MEAFLFRVVESIEMDIIQQVAYVEEENSSAEGERSASLQLDRVRQTLHYARESLWRRGEPQSLWIYPSGARRLMRGYHGFVGACPELAEGLRAIVKVSSSTGGEEETKSIPLPHGRGLGEGG